MNYHNFNIFNTYQNFTTILSLFPEENINIIFKTFEGKENVIYFPLIQQFIKLSNYIYKELENI